MANSGGGSCCRCGEGVAAYQWCRGKSFIRCREARRQANSTTHATVATTNPADTTITTTATTMNTATATAASATHATVDFADGEILAFSSKSLDVGTRHRYTLVKVGGLD